MPLLNLVEISVLHTSCASSKLRSKLHWSCAGSFVYKTNFFRRTSFQIFTFLQPFTNTFFFKVECTLSLDRNSTSTSIYDCWKCARYQEMPQNCAKQLRLHPHVQTWGLVEVNVLNNFTCDIVRGLFGAPAVIRFRPRNDSATHSDSVSGKLCPPHATGCSFICCSDMWTEILGVADNGTNVTHWWWWKMLFKQRK